MSESNLSFLLTVLVDVIKQFVICEHFMCEYCFFLFFCIKLFTIFYNQMIVIKIVPNNTNPLSLLLENLILLI